MQIATTYHYFGIDKKAACWPLKEMTKSANALLIAGKLT